MRSPGNVMAEQKVFHFVKRTPKCTREDVLRECSLASITEANQLLYALEAKKLVTRTSSNPPLWSVNFDKFRGSSAPSLPPSPGFESDQPTISSLNKSGSGFSSGGSSNPISTSHSGSAIPTMDRFPSELQTPVSVLEHIAFQYKLSLNFTPTRMIPEGGYCVMCSLSDAKNASRCIKAQGISIHESDANTEAALQLLALIAKLGALPFSAAVSDFLLNYYQTLQSAVDLCTKTLQESGTPNFSDYAVSLVRGQFLNENCAFVEFKRTAMSCMEFDHFQSFFEMYAWPFISGFINQLADGEFKEKNCAKIFFGVDASGLVQGIPFKRPSHMSNSDFIQTLREQHIKKLEDLSSGVQPKHLINKIIQVNIHEVLGESSLDTMLLVVEICISIPNFPSVCSVNDIFYEFKRGDLMKMSLEELRTRFTLPRFSFV